MVAEAVDAVSAESIAGFVFGEMARHGPSRLAAASVRPDRVPRLPRERRCARRDGTPAAKHTKPWSLPTKIARRFRHYWAEDRHTLSTFIPIAVEPEGS